MVTARDELRSTLAWPIATASNHPVPSSVLGRDLSKLIDAATDAVVVAGYSKPRVIKTAEYCRQCRDSLPYGAKLPRADFILWGKYFPLTAFGPKCYMHASEWFNAARPDQYAVYDLRPIHALIPEPTS